MTGPVKAGLGFFGLGSGISLWACAVIFAAGLAAGATPAYIWEHRVVTVAEAQRDAAKQAADLASQDAQRWHDASDQRDQQLRAMGDALTRQNAAVAKLQFSLDQANTAAAKAEADTRDARAQFDQRIQEIEDEAHAHPDQVVPLGPIVRGRVDRLWD